VIAVMCNPGLKARHWENMTKIARIDLMPDSSTTLRKMMLLNIMPYMEQFEAISACATKVLSHNNQSSSSLTRRVIFSRPQFLATHLGQYAVCLH